MRGSMRGAVPDPLEGPRRHTKGFQEGGRLLVKEKEHAGLGLTLSSVIHLISITVTVLI